MFCICRCTMTYQTCTLTSCEPVTHDTNLYRICLPDDVMMSIPTGRHIFISAQVQGMWDEHHTCAWFGDIHNF